MIGTPIESALVIFGSLGGADTIIVTYLKSLLLQVPWFAALEAQQQAILLQSIALIAGVALALGTQSNIVALFPNFATTPAWLGIVVTGLACGGGGSQLLYAVLTFLAGKPVVPSSAQGVAAVEPPEEYIPFS